MGSWNVLRWDTCPRRAVILQRMLYAPKSSSKIDCKAKVNAIVCPDGKYRLLNVFHEHRKFSRSWKGPVLRITKKKWTSKWANFLYLIMQACRYKNLTFGEENYGNYPTLKTCIRWGKSNSQMLLEDEARTPLSYMLLTWMMEAL